MPVLYLPDFFEGLFATSLALPGIAGDAPRNFTQSDVYARVGPIYSFVYSRPTICLCQTRIYGEVRQKNSMTNWAWADEGVAASPTVTPWVSMFLPIILIVFIFYFLVLRPESKKQKEHQAMLDKLKKGDKILTSGGLYGAVGGNQEKEGKEGVVVLKVAENVKVEVTRSSITSVKSEGEPGV